MKINGMEVPEWMMKHNSPQQLEKLMGVGKKTKPQQQKRPDPKELLAETEGDFGVLVILPNGMPQIVSMGQTEELAMSFAYQLSEDREDLAVEVFQSIPIEDLNT